MDNAIKTPNRTGILVRALIVLAMCGIVNSAAVFVSPMAKHFGWTTEAIAGVATYMAFMQTPGHILSGWLLGKIGAKKTLILGCILLGLAFLLSGMVPSGSPWMLYITFSVLQGLGVGFTTPAAPTARPAGTPTSAVLPPACAWPLTAAPPPSSRP